MEFCSVKCIYCKFEFGPFDDMFLGCLLTTGNPANAAARATASDQDGDIKRVSTKEWARSTGYDPVKLFNKVQVLLHTRHYFITQTVLLEIV